MDEQALISLAIAVAVFLTALFAAISAMFSAQSSRKAEKLLKWSIINDLLREYSSPEMNNGMKAVGDWFEENSQERNWPQKFAKLRKLPKGYKLDNYRRVFTHYNHRIYQFYRNRILDIEGVKSVASPTCVSFLIFIIEPIEKAMNPKYKRELFVFFRSLYPQGVLESQHQAFREHTKS